MARRADLDIDNRLRLGHARINPLNQHRLRESLNKNTTLGQILLMGGTYTDAMVDDLCTMIEDNSTLQTLQFMEEEFTDTGVSKLLRALCTNTSLWSLALRRCKVTDTVVEDLCLLSVQNSTLNSLQFHQATFTDPGLSKLLRSLCGNTSLLTLAFWESHLTDQVLNDLCMCIEENSVVKDVQFHKARFTDSGLSTILQSICTNATLESLVFSDSEVSDTVVPAMSSFLQENKVMTGLKFANAAFSDTGLSALLLSLIGNSRLAHMNLNDSTLSDAVIGELCHFIEKNDVMKHLVFEYAQFTDPGLSTLLQALSHNLAMERLNFRLSQVSDAIVLPMCRFLNENIAMKTLIFQDATFTDSGVAAIVQALMKNHTLEYLSFDSHLTDEVVSDMCRFIGENSVLENLMFQGDRLTDHGVSALVQSLTLNVTMETFGFGGSPLSDAVVSDLSKIVEDNQVIKEMFIVQPAGDAFIKPLMMFLKHREYITTVTSTKRGNINCLRTRTSDESIPSYYHIMTDNGQVKILPRSEYLQAELMDLLTQHSIPSAVDILNNLLVLFVQKDKEATFKEALVEKLQDVDVNIATAYRIHTVDNAPQLVFHNDDPEWKTGLSVHAPTIGDAGLISTVGAILVDDDGKLYLTSTFHGNKFEKCMILNKYEGRCVAEVFNKSPLLDACLIEVRDPEAKTKHSPTFPAPHVKVDASLCGPYIGPNDDLAKNLAPRRGQPPTAASRTEVIKYGITTFLTEGKLLYYNYTDPESDIDGALLVVSGPDMPFTEEGDSGAVIFRRSFCPDTHTDTVLCYEAIALNCAGLNFDSQDISVACRLDEVIEYFESKLGKKLKLVGTRTNTLEEFLYRIKLGLVLSEEEPLE